MNWIIIVGGMLAIFVTCTEELRVLCFWFIVAMYEYTIKERILRFYKEIIEYYPSEDCVKPKMCKFLFNRLNNISYKDVPKEMYFFYKNNEPYPQKAGRCHIMKEYRRGRKNFAVVCMEDTGEIRKKVLLLGEKNKDRKNLYNFSIECYIFNA